MDISIFKGFSSRLDLVPAKVHDDISELIFSQRQNVFSVCIVFNKLSSLYAVTTNIPSVIVDGSYNSYAVDLESLDTDEVRFYVRPKNSPSIEVIGYLADVEGNIIQKKIYKVSGKNTLDIDRYDASGALISPNEPEGRCSEQEWLGPKLLVDIARDNGLRTFFLKKFSKNQTYLSVKE